MWLSPLLSLQILNINVDSSDASMSMIAHPHLLVQATSAVNDSYQQGPLSEPI